MKPTLYLIFSLSLFLMLSCGDANTQQKASSIEAPQADSRLLKHIVLFKFKEAATAEEVQSIEAAFSALPSKIPQIHDYEWGLNNSPEGLEKGFTHCFTLSFLSEEDRAIYLPHPDHKAFGAMLQPILEDVLVVDYWND